MQTIHQREVAREVGGGGLRVTFVRDKIARMGNERAISYVLAHSIREVETGKKNREKKKNHTFSSESNN